MIGHVCALTIVGGLVLATCCPKRGNASSDRCPIGPSTAFCLPVPLQAHRAAAYTSPRPTNKVASLDYR